MLQVHRRIRKLKSELVEPVSRSLRALSKRQNWPAEPWPDVLLTMTSAFLKRIFAEKLSPSYKLFRISLLWLDTLD